MEKVNTCCAVLSFLILISGILLSSCSSNLYESILEKVIDFTPGKLLYDKWLTASPTLHFDIYFFNWTNPEELGDKTKKPTFKEIGPFRFDVIVEKTNVTFNKNNDTVTYGLNRWYKFNREGSVHDLNYTVTILNQLSAAAAYRAKELNFFLQKSVSVTLSSMSSVQMTKTVGELLFEGAHYKILNFFRTMAFTQTIPDKFGFFYEKNGSSDGIFNIGAGHKKYKLGTLYNWNGENSTKFFKEECRNVGGASMDFFTNNINEKMVEIFNPEICRKVPLEYVGKTRVHGLQGYIYDIGDGFLDNGTLIPGNECFCKDQCVRSGAVPATTCKEKTNNFISLPHFLKADPYYISQVEGLKPDLEKHSFHTIVEPVTGIPIEMNARLQMNIYIEPSPSISMYADAPSTLFPVMWFHHSMKLPMLSAWVIGILVNLKGIFIFLGVLLCIIGILTYAVFVFGYRKKRKMISDINKYQLSKEMKPLKEKHGNG